MAGWILPLVLASTGQLVKAQFDIESDWEDHDYDAIDSSY
jgi:hypothetical protein